MMESNLKRRQLWIHLDSIRSFTAALPARYRYFSIPCLIRALRKRPLPTTALAIQQVRICGSQEGSLLMF